ncbi:SAM-dependent methyltransferase [Nocardioides sp. BE266]|uniref:class I SAM-dependent methyltransferase n=1 Tax=Nocardioides sp. BE266 TaxID=2817725 RepID=UPI00285CC791|nr:class I SAM-dependent methyltransferase [Nocardioides sp. BE266]MDR7252605.1 SAM-dependent methyltransferase [Nocardioides sp. BE266]
MAFRQWAGSFAGGSVSSAMARLNARHPWSHNDHFHRWILANLPDQRHTALDVGCGQGALVAALAPRIGHVVGNDADEAMRLRTTERCGGLANVAVDGGDWTEVEGPLDLVTMVAVLHHLDVSAALRHVRHVLAPGGRFLVVGLAPPDSLTDHLWDAASIVTNPVIGFVKHPRVSRAGVQPASYPVQGPTMTYDDLCALVEEVMPGATMRHRLGFRHTIAWTKPA